MNKTEEAQGLVEYALILVLVSIVVIAVLALVGPQIGVVFSQIRNALGATTSSGYTIVQFDTDGTDSAGGCIVNLHQSLIIEYREGGNGVPGQTVNATVSVQNNAASRSFTGVTDASGRVTFAQYSIIGTDPVGCGRIATASVGNVSATDRYD